MRKSYLFTAVVLMVAVGTSLVTANKPNEGDGYSITISPNNLVLSSPDTVVTVHSNIPYGSVDTGDYKRFILTNENKETEPVSVSAGFIKPDACGDLVVKFSKADVKDIVVPKDEDYIATLTLSGPLNNGTTFEVSDEINVRP